MKAKDFDKKFDEGKDDLTDALDWSAARRTNRLEQKRINVDIPVWMVEALDREAARIGVTRQSIIKMWLSQRVDEKEAKGARPDSSSGLGIEVRLKLSRWRRRIQLQPFSGSFPSIT